MLNHYRDAGIAISENPFAALKPFKKGDSRYISRIDPMKVLDRAYRELVESTPAAPALRGIAALNAKKGASDPLQVYRVILLGTMTGLRRSELDRLHWSHIDFSRDCLTVQSTSDGTVKAAGSTRDVDLPADLVELLKVWKTQSKSLYVIECAKPHKVGTSFRSYRCGRIFDKASVWLRKTFLPGENHPLHTLRKEYGSLITKSAGIHAAADLLGHRDIRTASEYYVVRKTRAFTGLSVPHTPTLKRARRNSRRTSI
jgi:integrase